jgi:hypothetical protein
MTLLRVLLAETLKMKRTIALAMVAIIPVSVGILTLIYMAARARLSPEGYTGTGQRLWTELAYSNLLIWALLMLPLFITLETALIAGLDHAENQWKNLLARPVPRWTFYVAKLLVVMAMTATSTAALVCVAMVIGAVLLWFHPEIPMAFPIPFVAMFRQGAQVAGLSFLTLTIQHWVSLRWRAFSVATGTGVVLMVTSYMMAASSVSTARPGWEQYFPGALPMLALARQPHNVAAALWISTGIGLIVVAVGCWDFCRREVN